jgi:hypothetical protein
MTLTRLDKVLMLVGVFALAATTYAGGKADGRYAMRQELWTAQNLLSETKQDLAGCRGYLSSK